MKIAKVISGGQSGADQAGLFAAADLNIPTGGTVPNGWRTDEGEAPWLADYGLVQHFSNSYPPRTKLNVQNSDITFIFGNDASPGCTLTKNLCREYSKPFILIKNFDADEKIKCYRYLMEEMGDNLTINVAGNREKSSPGIEKKTTKFLKELFSTIMETE